MTRTLEELDAEVTALRQIVDRLAPKGDIRVGENVFFFSNDAPGTPPLLAQVTLVHAPFLVDLKMWNGEKEVGRKSVHSRQFAKDKQLSKAQISQMGIWDRIDAHYAVVDEENARLAKLKAEREAVVAEQHRKWKEDKAKAAGTPVATQATPEQQEPVARPRGPDGRLLPKKEPAAV